MVIGIAFDKKEDYSFENDAAYFDFTTAAELSNVKKALEKCGYTVKLLGNYQSILSQLANNKLKDIDLVFNMSEGIKSRNREGAVPSLLEMAQIPYTGTDAYGLSLCLNKYHSKIIAEHLGIQTAEYFIINSPEDIEGKKIISFPYVLKPILEGTSSGVKLVNSYEEYASTAQALLQIFDQPLLCEQYIDGREFTVSLIGTGTDTIVVGIIETVRKNGAPLVIFSSEDKIYGNCKRILVQNMTTDIKNLAFNWAIKFHHFVECRDLNRIDYRMDKDGKLYFLEANPLPGLSLTSAFPNCCLLNDIPFEDAMNKIIQSALKRYS